MDPETNAVVASGLHLRPFCSPYFSRGIEGPYYDEHRLAYVVRNVSSGKVALSLW